VPVRDFGAGPVRAELLEGMTSGDMIAANAMTEDAAGSDIATLATTVVRDGPVYVLDGVKSFVSNAPAADVFVVYATSDPDGGFLGQTAFAVPRDLPGITVSEPFAKMGLDACPAGRGPLPVFIDNLEKTASGNWRNTVQSGGSHWSALAGRTGTLHKRMRGTRPFVMTNLKKSEGLDRIVGFIEAKGGLQRAS